MFLVIRARDAIGAQQRSVIDVKSYHHELPILEPQARVPRGSERELCVGPVMYFEDALRSYSSQDKVTCCISMVQNATELAGTFGFSGTWPNSLWLWETGPPGGGDSSRKKVMQ